MPFGPINAPQDHELHAPSWFDNISKKLSVKADLAIYCLVLGACG